MPAAPKVVLLAGASGLVGHELLRLLLASPDCALIHSLVRRGTPAAAATTKLREHVVSFDALPALPACEDVYIALGTTIKAAGSQAAFRRVDHDYVVEVARAGRVAGATRLGVVSALGADPTSSVFYNRVKGEMQEAVTKLGYQSVVIAQPSLLIGDREALQQPARAGEIWAQRLLGPFASLIPARLRPVHATAVAAALLSAVQRAGPGVSLLRSRDMHVSGT